MDLHAHLPGPLNRVLIYPGRRVTIQTAIEIEIPVGYEGQIRPRSGLAEMYGLTVLNSPGTIDSDYRGQIYVILLNTGDRVFEVCDNLRIAQLVLCRVSKIVWESVPRLSETRRGRRGRGSTGVNPILIELGTDSDVEEIEL